MKVIGYYYNIKDILKHHQIKSDELIGSTVQLCFSKNDIENPEDIIEEMLNKNIAKIISINQDIAKIMLEYPIPENVFKKYYLEEIPIYE